MKEYNGKPLVEGLLEEIEYVYKSDKRPWVIGYSGGKDSTVVVHLVYQMLKNLRPEERHKTVYIVSSDTLVENPLIKIYLDNMLQLLREAAKRDHLPLSVNKVTPEPDTSFWTNVIGRGFPTPRLNGTFRWCTDRLKIAPSGQFVENIIKEQHTEIVFILGVRKAESAARKRRIEGRELADRLLNRHETIKEAYVYPPITIDELRAIDRIWDEEQDLSCRVLVDLYYDEMGQRLPWDELKHPVFDEETCKKLEIYANEFLVPMDLMKSMIFRTNKTKFFSNTRILRDSLRKAVTQQWLQEAELVNVQEGTRNEDQQSDTL